MKRLVLTPLVALSFLMTFAQQQPFFTQYIYDPYIINPSMVGASGRSEVNLLYRQQWTGVANAPQTLQFDAQLPLNSRIAMGLNVYDDKTVLLSNTSAMVTFGYKVPLAAEHIVGFGISAGIISNRIRLEDASDVDLLDPVLFNAANNNFGFDGQFGVNYSFRSFVLGFSLTKLTNNKVFSVDEFQDIKFDQLKNRVVFTSYRFNLSSVLALQPSLAYHLTSDDNNFYEALAFFSYRNVLDVGGGYRENFGPSAMVRVSWKNLQVGYSYEFPGEQIGVSLGNTNEIQLKWRFGRIVDQLGQKNENKSTPAIADNAVAPAKTPVREPEEEDTERETQPERVASTPTNEKTTPTYAQNEAAATNNNQQEDNADDYSDAEKEFDDNNDNKEWYLIVGTFEKRVNAEHLARDLAKENIYTEVKYVKSAGYYYVHLPLYKTKDITLDKIMNVRRNNLFKDAWYKQLD